MIILLWNDFIILLKMNSITFLVLILKRFYIYDFIFTRNNRPHSFNKELAPLVKGWSLKSTYFSEKVLQFCLTTTFASGVDNVFLT